MSYSMFNVGDRVLIHKPANPAISWNTGGAMDKYIGTEQIIVYRDQSRFRIADNESWSFSWDCAIKPESLEPDEVDEDGVEMVRDCNGDLIPKEDAIYTTYDGWVHCDDVVTSECGRYTMHQDNVDDHDFAYDRRGELYRRCDLRYVEDTGEYHHEDEIDETFFWHSDSEEYYSYPPKGMRHDYHSGPRNDYSDRSKFRFGVEVEKEDGSVLNSWDLNEVDATGWARERDGSLDDDDGYELVSPLYDLFGDKFDSDVSKSVLADHIDADVSERCGGHMGFSIRGKSGPHAFDLYNGFFPLLFAMYRGRLRGDWSKVRKNEHLKNGSYRYSAVNVRGEYIEFRIFSAIRDTNQLLWRRDLLRIMASNPKKGVMWWISQALNQNSKLHKHLSKVYATPDKIASVCAYAAAIAEHMNGRSYDKYIHFMNENEVNQAKRFVRNL